MNAVLTSWAFGFGGWIGVFGSTLLLINVPNYSTLLTFLLSPWLGGIALYLLMYVTHAWINVSVQVAKSMTESEIIMSVLTSCIGILIVAIVRLVINMERGHRTPAQVAAEESAAAAMLPPTSESSEEEDDAESSESEEEDEAESDSDSETITVSEGLSDNESDNDDSDHRDDESETENSQQTNLSLEEQAAQRDAKYSEAFAAWPTLRMPSVEEMEAAARSLPLAPKDVTADDGNHEDDESEDDESEESETGSSNDNGNDGDDEGSNETDALNEAMMDDSSSSSYENINTPQLSAIPRMNESPIPKIADI